MMILSVLILNNSEYTFLRTFLLCLILIFANSSTCYTQKRIEKVSIPNNSARISLQVKSSPAYAELLLRKTERESELEEFALDYTDEFPKVKEIKFELNLVSQEMSRILAVKAEEAGKLTLALGKLLVRKTEIETDLWNLRRQYNADHPEVKRAKRKVEIYERAIKEILP